MIQINDNHCEALPVPSLKCPQYDMHDGNNVAVWALWLAFEEHV